MIVTGFEDTHVIAVKRTDAERQQALTLHKLAGLRKGDEISITKEYLPGAILFPCQKLKQFVENEVQSTDIPGGSDEASSLSSLINTENVSVTAAQVTPVIKNSDESKDVHENKEKDLGDNNEVEKSSDEHQNIKIIPVHRYLVVTKERFMVLDANGGGVGSTAVVKSNHHLTEVIFTLIHLKNCLNTSI